MGNVSLVTYDQIYEYLKDRGITAFKYIWIFTEFNQS